MRQTRAKFTFTRTISSSSRIGLSQGGKVSCRRAKTTFAAPADPKRTGIRPPLLERQLACPSSTRTAAARAEQEEARWSGERSLGERRGRRGGPAGGATPPLHPDRARHPRAHRTETRADGQCGRERGAASALPGADRAAAGLQIARVTSCPGRGTHSGPASGLRRSGSPSSGGPKPRRRLRSVRTHSGVAGVGAVVIRTY